MIGICSRALMVWAVSLFVACMPPSGGGAGTGDPGCDPGETTGCRCSSGEIGTRTCQPSGRLGDCVCEEDEERRDAGGGVVLIPDNPDAFRPGPPDAPVPMSGGSMACSPDCIARECGPDPRCGLSCGQCGVAERCINAQCVLDESEFGFRDVVVANDRVYTGEIGSVSLRFGGPVETVSITAPELGVSFYLDAPANRESHIFEISWASMNDRVRFDFDVDGQDVFFTAVIRSPSGAEDSARFGLRFLCRGNDGGNAPACNGECAPNVDLGCKCIDGARVACDGDTATFCDNSEPPVDCETYGGADAPPGFCLDDVYGDGNAGCVMTVGGPCYFRDADDSGFYVYCGARGAVDPTMGCVDGICVQNIPRCPDPADAYCNADFLIYACVESSAGALPVGVDCRGEQFGGVDGDCDANRCVQPDAGGFCIDGYVRCAGEMTCVADPDDEDGVGECVVPEMEEPGAAPDPPDRGN